MNNSSLAIIKNVRLTKAQTHLYSLICDKIKKDQKLVYEEAEDIYLCHVHRYMRNGIPHRYDYWVPLLDSAGNHRKGDSGSYLYTSQLVPMTKDELIFAVLHWLTDNIGRLVLKGYLTVLPAVELGVLKA